MKLKTISLNKTDEEKMIIRAELADLRLFKELGMFHKWCSIGVIYRWISDMSILKLLMKISFLE